MEIKDPCGEVIYSQEIGPFTQDAKMNSVSIPSSRIQECVVTGKTVNCDDHPVENGICHHTVRKCQENFHY
jgi:hypothetical protein